MYGAEAEVSHGCIIKSGQSIGGRLLFIPMKVAQKHMNLKKLIPVVK